jgi:hypothetical protein
MDELQFLRQENERLKAENLELRHQLALVSSRGGTALARNLPLGLAAIYIISLLLPAARFDAKEFSGTEAFWESLEGCYVCLRDRSPGTPWVLIGWAPNLLFFFGVICLATAGTYWKRTLRFLASVAGLLGVLSGTYWLNIGSDLPLLPGYWVWEAAMLSLAIGPAMVCALERKSKFTDR